MAIVNVLKTDTFDSWRISTNDLGAQLGDNALLVANTTLESDNAVDAILEVLVKAEYEVGDITTLTTNSSNLVNAINEHDAEMGVLSTLTTTSKNHLVGSINELDAELGVLSTLTTTAKGTIVSSINELDSDIGALSTLNTTATNNVVSSINSLLALEDSRYGNTLKLDLTHSTVGGNNNSTQEILSNVSMPAGKTLTIDGTLDIANGTLIVGGAGGTLNIQTTFLALGDVDATVASSGGVIVSRGKFGSTPRPDVRVYWDEPTKNWTVKKLDDDGTSVITPFLIDSHNLKNLIVNNTENGIAVTYDGNANKFNFDVNDFTITLTGDVTGSGTVTNLGNVSIEATIPNNRVVLGADTQGNYIATMSAAADSGITLTGNSGETAAVTVAVNNTVVRTLGVQSIAGVKTFSEKPVFSSGITTNDSSTMHSLEVSNDLTVNGNFTVLGTVTTVNTETINLADNVITLNSNYIGNSPSENGGIEIERGTLTNVSLVWNESTDKWTFSDQTSTYDVIGQVLAGAGMSGGGQGPSITISHADTSSQASVNNSGGVVVQDIALDTFGHISSITSYDLDGRYYTETESDSLYPRKNGIGATGTWGIGISGNAATSTTATRLAAARTITCGGDLTGSVLFDGSANVVLNAEVINDSHSHTSSTITGFVESVQDVVGGMFTAPNIENGISIYYDDTNGKIQSDVNDFSITLAGAVSGSATINNLGSVTINTTVSNDTHSHDSRYYTEAEADSRFVNATGDTMTGRLVVPAGTSGGIAFPDNSFGGTGDNASITLRTNGGETTVLTIQSGNDADDIVNVVVPSQSGLRVNDAVVWNSGNDGSGSGLDADTLDGQHLTNLDARYINAGGDTMTGNFYTTHIYPLANSTYNIGAATGRYNVMYANVFNGTATSANYADLAEKYLADDEYSVGTVVMIGGEKEITLAEPGCRALGVVSENPAFMMNSELEGGTYIALKGRVPVKVVGKVKKGQRLIADVDGYSSTIGDKCDAFAIALESSDDEGRKLIEAVIL